MPYKINIVKDNIPDNFPEQEKLRQAFTSDPFSESVYSKINSQNSYEKLPSLSSFSNQSRADSAMNAYLNHKVFSKKRQSENRQIRTGVKDIQLDPSRIVVFKKGRALNAGYYIVEFSYTSYYFLIVAFDIETNDYFVKKLNCDETEQMFNYFENNYDNIADNLSIKGNKIFINKYKSKAEEEIHIHINKTFEIC